jgi:hypothetical protein
MLMDTAVSLSDEREAAAPKPSGGGERPNGRCAKLEENQGALMYSLTRRTVLLVALCAPAVACTSSDIPATTPTPTTTSITEVFTGTLNPTAAGTDASTYTFTVTAAGNVTATLVSVGGDNPPKIGMSIGTWNGSSCNVAIANDAAVAGSTVIGQASAAGSLCLRIYDVGGIQTSVPYQAQVTHF